MMAIKVLIRIVVMLVCVPLAGRELAAGEWRRAL